MEEMKMRTVEVSIWTPGLNMADIRPVSREFANKCIEEGETSEDVYDDFEFSIPVYFCDDSEVNITVKDGDKEKKYTEVNLQGLDFGCLYEVKDSELNDWCDRDDYDSDEEYAEAIEEQRFDDDEFYCAWLTKNINLDEAGYTFQQFWDACLEDYNGGLNNYLKPVSEEAINNGEGEDMVNYLELGEIGKGEITFRIEIPEDEEFELKKLHFVNGGDIEDFPAGFDVFLSATFIILDAVEYDGRIYCEKDAVFAPGWRECYGEGFYNADLTEFEPEEE